MGLKGQLEDLPLLDMLQIVAFSKKSGYLKVAGPPGKGAVILKEGRVLFAYSWSTIAFLRELAHKKHEGIEQSVIREHIETSVRELAGLREGSFQFELAESIADELGDVSIAPFLLAGGLDPQELLLDLAVELDNERQETTSLLELAFKGQPPPAAAPSEEDVELSEAVAVDTPPPALPQNHLEELAPVADSPAIVALPDRPVIQSIDEPGAPSTYSVVLVDDELPVTQVVGAELENQGYKVFTASTPSEGTALVKERVLDGERVIVVVDLKMPTTSGNSFYGGFELVRLVNLLEARPPVLLMVEVLSEKARARARELGIRRLAYKPTLTKPDPEQYRIDLVSFATTIGGELSKLANDAHQLVPKADSGPGNKPAERMDFLAAMTKQLVEPNGSTDISRLVLQVAGRFLERGVLFVIKGDMARGLAGFGFGTDEAECSAIAQKLAIDIPKTAALAEVVRMSETSNVSSDLNSLDDTLFAQIGRGQARAGVLIPLLYNRAPLLLLYGDNAVSGRRMGDLGGLELFIAQAGMALENKLLQRKLTTLDPQMSMDTGARTG